MNRPRCVLIIGAGIAGPVLALLLKKAGFCVHLFEASDGPSEAGGALGLAPNGMNVLAAAGVAELVRDVSVTGHEWAFENQRGKLLACTSGGDTVRYGQPSVMITRAALHKVLVEQAEAGGISISYGKRLVHIEDEPNRPVSAHFSDGTVIEGDLVIGADGIRSQVRQAIMPDAPKPEYTGMLAPGGYSPCMESNLAPRSHQRVHFIFGKNGFFGYFHTLTADGPRTLWWSTAAAPLDSRDQMAATTQEKLRTRLMNLHGDWAHPVPQLIESATSILNVAIHDVPNLPRWSAGRTLLIGDAAHAVAPHSGQGASMALEDAHYLAKLLHESADAPLGEVFAAFEAHRRPRTDRVIALGRRNGQRKAAMSPFAYWIQQQLLRIFVPLSRAKRQEWLLSYKVNWQPPTADASAPVFSLASSGKEDQPSGSFEDDEESSVLTRSIVAR